MKVIIFTEAGPEFGYGHLMRCLALAEGFREKSLNVIFVVRGEGEFSHFLKDYTVFKKDWLKYNILFEFFDINDLAIVDSYYANEQVCKEIYNAFSDVLFFDDMKRIKYPGGFVLNGVIGAENLGYSFNKKIKYLLGPNYQPLRKEFWQVQEFEVKDIIRKVLITFGGSDITNLTPFYIKQAHRKYPNAEIIVVIGSGFKNKKEIENLNYNNLKLVYSPEALAMKNLMLNCDLAISAAGQTISELASIGVPSIGIQVAENQKYNIENWQRCGFLLSENMLSENIPFDIRKKRSFAGRHIIDGLGVKRIVEAMIC